LRVFPSLLGVSQDVSVRYGEHYRSPLRQGESLQSHCCFGDLWRFIHARSLAGLWQWLYWSSVWWNRTSGWPGV